jgi:hypothetical protein
MEGEMLETTIRRCGNCAWTKMAPRTRLFLDLTCDNQLSVYYRKARNRGYFGCLQHHFPLGYLRDLSK